MGATIKYHNAGPLQCLNGAPLPAQVPVRSPSLASPLLQGGSV